MAERGEKGSKSGGRKVETDTPDVEQARGGPIEDRGVDCEVGECLLTSSICTDSSCPIVHASLHTYT